MNKTDPIKSLAIAIEEKELIIKKLEAELGNYDVQIGEYQQIVKELSDKLEMYQNKYGKVFKSSGVQK
jgi:hypothetical protein